MSRRGVIVTVVALAATVTLVWLGVLDPVHAALLAAVVVGTAYVWRTLDEGEDLAWQPVPEDRRDGARNDVSELGWASFTRNGAVGDRMRRRLRALAAARLAEHGIDLDDPGRRADADRLLGPDVVEGLTSRRPAYRGEVHRWLDAIDALVPSPAHRAPSAQARTSTQERRDA